MLLSVVAFAAAQVSGAAASPPAPSPVPAQAVTPKPKKKRHVEECTGTEAMTGSHLIPCEPPDPHDLELQQMNGAAMLRFAPADGSSMSNQASGASPH